MRVHLQIQTNPFSYTPYANKIFNEYEYERELDSENSNETNQVKVSKKRKKTPYARTYPLSNDFKLRPYSKHTYSHLR